MHFGDELQDFAAPQVIVKDRVVGQVAHLAFDGGAVAVAIEAIDQHAAAAGNQDAHQHADGGGLAGPVRPQESEDFSLSHLQGKRVHGVEGAVALGQTLEYDHRASCNNINNGKMIAYHPGLVDLWAFQRALRNLDLDPIRGRGRVEGWRRGRVDVEQGERQMVDADGTGGAGHGIGQDDVGGARAGEQTETVADIAFPHAHGALAAAAVVDAFEFQGIGGRDGDLFARREHVGDAARRVFRVAGAAGRAAASQHGQTGDEQGQQQGTIRAGQVRHVFPFR